MADRALFAAAAWPPAPRLARSSARVSADGTALASSDGASQVATAAWPGWAAAAVSGDPRGGVAARAREPALGPPPDLWRTRQARLQRLADEHPPAARSRRAGTGAAALRPELARVPADAGSDHRCVRFLHDRDGLAPPLLRVLLHRAWEPSRLARRLHG